MMEIPSKKQHNPGLKNLTSHTVRNIIIPLVVTGAVVGGAIAAVTFYNKAQQRDLAAGVLTAMQKGSINDVYDACLKLVNTITPSPRAQSYFEWAGCNGTQKVCVQNDGAGNVTEAPIAACNQEAVNPPGPNCSLSTSTATSSATIPEVKPEFGEIMPTVR